MQCRGKHALGKLEAFVNIVYILAIYDNSVRPGRPLVSLIEQIKTIVNWLR